MRRLQSGEQIGLPHSRPLPAIGRHCHELRILDAEQNFRIIYRIDPDAIVIVHVFAKKTSQTPRKVVHICRRRLREYDLLTEEVN